MRSGEEKLGQELVHAAWRGETERVRDLLGRGVDVDATDAWGTTAALWAAEGGHLDILRQLTQLGANLDAKESRGFTALIEAARRGHLEVVQHLVEHGANVGVKNNAGDSALIVAAAAYHCSIIRFLVESGADVDVRNRRGDTALIQAAEKGSASLAGLLLRRGADVNARNNAGDTALICAARRGQLDVVRLLAWRGADVNAEGHWRSTALIQAAAENQVPVVRLLLSLGACPNASDQSGDTAIHVAAKHGNEDAVRLLTPLVKPAQREPEPEVEPSGCLHSWLIPPLEIELLEFVDKAHIGGDYFAKWLDARVVVKLFVPDASGSSFADQVNLWRQLRHPNVTKLYGACDDGRLQFFVCEHASNGSLDEFLASCRPEQRLPWTLLLQAALGLEFLHERKVVHGDLRCRNILVGSDGLVKLAGFGLSGPPQARETVTKLPRFLGSMRWQSPERLRGLAASPASDVYSLGMCIVEVLTGGALWSAFGDTAVRDIKDKWTPENGTDLRNGPPGITGEARELVSRMCCQNPRRRLKAGSVVYELERFAMDETSHGSDRSPEQPMNTIDNFNRGEVARRWAAINALISEHHGSLDHLHQQFEELKTLFQKLQADTYCAPIFRKFDQLLIDFHDVLVEHTSAGQARILRVSTTRATSHRGRIFYQRMGLLWRMLDNSTRGVRERERRWSKQRDRQIECFVAEMSKVRPILNELKCVEERSSFLGFLKEEATIHSAKYTDGQLHDMKRAYEDIASGMELDELTAMVPEWFIPWYELRRDQSSSLLGKGGFGTVHRAKWLNSDVVVKQMLLAGDTEAQLPGSHLVSWISASDVSAKAPIVEDSAMRAARTAATKMFEREVNIWFGLNHPHVVRLFGACHVGVPFFVCEYAANGTLVEYLRTNPDQLWQLLLETALGVQYLHARNIVHGDLKGNNIVIGSDGKARVTDFGLSASISSVHEAEAQITGAWHWVAPECLAGKRARPTFASDIYSLGMCVVEAMRVVDSVQQTVTSCPLPWGNLPNLAVKVLSSRGELPAHPSGCTSEQWTLVMKMCRLEPSERIKISTVVDELAKLAMVETTAAWIPDDLLGSSGSAAQATVVERLSAARKRLVDDTASACSPDHAAIYQVYMALWGRLQDVCALVTDRSGFTHHEDLRSLVDAAVDRAAELKTVHDTLGELTEARLHGYTLHRQLDKFISAHFLNVAYATEVLSGEKAC